MLNRKILSADLQDFIQKNLHTDISNLVLRTSPFQDVSSRELAQQVEGKTKSKAKLPLWYATEGIYYPAKLSLEQASSEATARYKASLVKGRLLDATGGFGVDDYFFAQHCEEVVHCELQKELSLIVQHNFQVLGQENILCVCGDSYAYLKGANTFFNFIYIDPSRRDVQKNRVFRLEDCEPNVPDTLDFLWQYTNAIFVKTSPMLDITRALGQLPQTTQVHIVAVENEVKELLFLLEKEAQGRDVLFKTVNMRASQTDLFSFCLSEKQRIDRVTFTNTGNYLYEPNAALLKANAFDLLANVFDLKKVAKDSHLYLSNVKHNDFQGRIFSIEEILPFSKSVMKAKDFAKANITTRNFPLSVAQLRAQFRIKEGGDTYLFFTTDAQGEKKVFICKKTYC